jgi:flagellin
MANIGATTAFYKVETSLTRANNEVSKSMERLATGKQNANAGDRSSYVAMADTFRLDYVGTKAGIKGASVVMGYLETGMRVLDSASSLLSRLQELAVLGANSTNTTADSDAIDFEAEQIADELDRLLTTATYKGKSAFVSSAGSEYVSLGGRDAEMTFGVDDLTNDAAYALFYDTLTTDTDVSAVKAGRTYEVVAAGVGQDLSGIGGASTAVLGQTFIATASDSALGGSYVAEKAGHLIEAPSAAKGVTTVGDATLPTDLIEAVQALVNTRRVQAGSQYAAIESAVNYTTDLTAQYELGYNTVNDVNFSMETAHLAKNQILQQAATAMLAQANSGQQGLLQLIT